ncbi:MAG: hypothetical protein M1836_002565 [Candelina mexicana]|nr:MAG: hypothetical protein M1836_002565 [Candelina mexicana]
MPQNKARLYVALYARGGSSTMPGQEDTYHWSFMVGPKIEKEGGSGMRYHAKVRPKQGGGLEWYFEERDCPLAPTNMLLVRVMIAKVEDHGQLSSVLRSTPIRQGEQGWNCVLWIKEALEELQANGKALGTRVTEWAKVREGVMTYIQRKKDQHRFDGRGHFDTSKVPTYDLIEQKETVP